MKILVIDEEFPFPLNTGKRIRSFSLLKRLAIRNTLRYVAYGEESTESFRRMREHDMDPIAVPPRVPRKSGLVFYYRLIRNLASRDPYIVESHYSKLFHARVDEQIQEFRPDIVLCEWTPYAKYIERCRGPIKIISAHNVESQIWQRYYENEKSIIKKQYIMHQHRKVLRFERSAICWADGVTAVSRGDGRILSNWCTKTPIEVVDNGVDLNYFSPGAVENRSGGVVFTGSMDWRPNQDAVRYFVDNVLPILQKSGLTIESIFVGRDPPPDIRALSGRSGVVIKGTVADVRPYIRRATMCIVPLRIGGGSRLKILEAMAMGKPVVSTSVGAEGLEVTHGANILLADTPLEFAESIEAVLRDDGLAQRLGEAGRQLVVERYGWDTLADRLDRFLVRMTRTNDRYKAFVS